MYTLVAMVLTGPFMLLGWLEWLAHRERVARIREEARWKAQAKSAAPS